MSNPLLDIFNNRKFLAFSLIFLVVAMELIFLGAEKRMAGVFEFGLDDSWIHATFARNLAEGKGFSFNPGEPISGSTAPLYTFMLAGWYTLTGEVIWGAKLMGMISFALLCFFMFRATFILTKDNFTAWFTSALCATSLPLLFDSLNGMETICYVALVAGVIYLFALKKYRWMITVAALGVWFRPEGVLLLGIAWLLAVPKQDKWITLAIGSAIVLPYFYFNYTLGGNILPHTVVAKSKIQNELFSKFFLIDTWVLAWNLHFFFLFLLFPLGAVLLWKQNRWLVVFPAAFLLMYWGTSTTAASLGRYLHPALPFTYLVVATGGHFLWTARPEQRQWVMVIMIGLFLMNAGKSIVFSSVHGLAVQNIHGMQVSIGQTIPLFTQPTDTIGTNDIGAIGYFGDRYVLDLVGLVSPVKPINDNLRDSHPALLAIFNTWFPERDESIEFTANYQFLANVGLTQNVVCGDSVMTLYARNDRMDDFVSRLNNLPLQTEEEARRKTPGG